MIWRSMPFSLLTCSMTRFRSGSMMVSCVTRGMPWAAAPARGALGPGRGNSNSVARPLDRVAAAKRHDARVGIVDGDGVVGDGFEDPVELPPPAMGSCVRTSTRWPTARAKCSGRTSGRLSPGDEHSR